MAREPLVAVVTPVYNGMPELRACVESVLAQSYRNWIYIIADNASSDSTLSLANSFAQRDPRVVVRSHSEYLPQMQNWNRAMRCVPGEPRYIKHLNADDRMAPDCLRSMVEAAERHPQAALVSSYFEYGGEILPNAKQEQERVIAGRDIVRVALLGGVDFLATSTVLLLRREAAGNWPELFDTGTFPPGHSDDFPSYQADKQAYFDPLDHADLVFVPRVLTYLGKQAASTTGHASRLGAWLPGRLQMMLRHQERLTPGEVSRALRYWVAKYVRSLTWRLLSGQAWRDPALRNYQGIVLRHLLPELRASGHTFEARLLRPFEIILRMLSRLLDRAASPS